MTEYVTCSCCGGLIPDTEADNADFKERGHDQGYGLCRNCGGFTPGTWEEASHMTEAEFKKQQGWAMTRFYEARIPVVRKALKPERQPAWDAKPYWWKCMFIEQQVQKGNLI